MVFPTLNLQPSLTSFTTSPFASICGYVNYLSFPARNWNVGLSFGLYFTASKFLR